MWANIWQQVWEWRRAAIASSSVAGCVLLMRFFGLLQPSEWAFFDYFVRIRPIESRDDRIVIVEINESDIQYLDTWPMSDRLMVRLLQKLSAAEPRAIGLDIYRDVPVGSGHEKLVEIFENTPNLIGIEKLEDARIPGVKPPSTLAKRDRVGFNNMIIDSDGHVRRGVLYLKWTDRKLHKSFALALALLYLQEEGIKPKGAANNDLKLGKVVFPHFEPNDGAYVRADSRGYQFIANFRGSASYWTTVSLTDVLEDRVSPELLRDRVVLIGSTAPSLRDFFKTPYSGDLLSSPKAVAGVKLHADFVSQILSGALEGRPMIRVWSQPIEILWIVVWSCLGASVSWKLRSPKRSGMAMIVLSGVLFRTCYWAFLQHWWLPLVPALLTLVGSTVVIIGYIAHLEEELHKSKEFLQSVIDTIPDPVFVKGKDHRCLVLNEAYCEFVGRPFEQLRERSDYEVFPQSEADLFWQKDESVFESGESKESEERLTDVDGRTHLIATKRSLHRDAAGNVFLVGVIRDITERKRIEEELKRTAAELASTNEQLKLSEHRLRHQAYHDDLTGLPNRKLFAERLSQALEWARDLDRSVGLLFLDLDGFKAINDTLGHDMGDLLLKAVAKRLTGCLRGSDTVSRLGGDEFTVILPGIPKLEDAQKVADKVIATLSEVFAIEGNRVSVTTSIGISLYPQHGGTADDLIKLADTAMYRAKERGKNQYAFVESSDLPALPSPEQD
jgi:diguanylate cyclase (GGDEF)-like protein/PAS domain S-box-containing protein